MQIRANEGFDLLTFYLVLSLLLLGLIVVLLIRTNQTLRKINRVEREITETHRKTDQVRHNLVYTGEELKSKLESDAVQALVEEKAREKAKEYIAVMKNEGGEGER